MSEEDAIDSYWKGIVELFWKLRNRSTTVERKILRSFGMTENYSEHLNRNVQLASSPNNPRVKLHSKMERNQIQQR